MNAFSDEIRLLGIVLLNTGLFAAAYSLARRHGTGGALQAICDAFLLYFLMQYAAVALPGICGTLSGWTMALAAIIPAIGWSLNHIIFVRQSISSFTPHAMLGAENGAAARTMLGRTSRWNVDHFGLLACTLFSFSYLASYAFIQRYIPPVATDALVYHLPTAVQWIQTHRLGIYATWYWNPAASYSPGAGSIFIAWWMLPAGNDVFVRFVQVPPLIFIFFLTARIARLLGCKRTVAGLVAVAATLSRPLFSEAIVQKDDLYVTSFIVAAVLSLARENCRDPLGPWRVGIAIGFVLASKYTALLACPVFLFLVDSPFWARWRGRHGLLALGLILVMALPWYVRNMLLTGNPLYPVAIKLPFLHLPGLFGTERDQQLRSAAGVWKMLSETYHSIPLPLILFLIAAWVWTWIVAGRRVLRDPLSRACVLGSVVTLVVFLITSPHHEVRYIFPLIVLWFASAGMAIGGGIASRKVQVSVAVILAAISTASSFSLTLIGIVSILAAIALGVAALGVTAAFIQLRLLRLRGAYLAAIACVALAATAMYAYVEWGAYVEDYRQARLDVWQLPAPQGYPRQGAIWKWVNETLPPDAPLAYANSYFVYPCMGFNLMRPVVYAPVRRGLHDFQHFPRMGDKVPGDLIVQRMTEVMDADPDMQTWLLNLRAANAEYLMVMKFNAQDPARLDANPPELQFARMAPERFKPMYEDEAGIVFHIDLK